MLAVLPFENLTGDAAQDYFSDGMTDEMITQLGSLDPERIGVIARTSVMHYKHSQEELQQIAHELGVQYVLEGTVRRDTDRVRITAQLIQMRDQTHLWARAYDRNTRDLLVMQSEIAKEISGEIRTSLGEHNPITPVLQPTLSSQGYEAYNLYLEGQYFWNKRTAEGFQEAIGYFQQATAKRPELCPCLRRLGRRLRSNGWVHRGSGGRIDVASESRRSSCSRVGRQAARSSCGLGFNCPEL
jgi:TolB-like protein